MSPSEDLEKIARQAVLAELAADNAAKRQFDQTYYSVLVDTAKASIDRNRASGELIEKAAAAIAGLYAAIVGVSFSVTDRPISARALLPVLFLGIAIVCAMVYLAFPTQGMGTPVFSPTTSRPERMRRQAEQYINIVTELVYRRLFFLRAAVVALGVAVATLPAPFINDLQIGSDSTDAALPDFPGPPQVDSDASAAVEAIRYQAQIDEVVAGRASSSPLQENWPDWAWWMLGVGLLLTFGIPTVMAALARRNP